MTDDRLSAVELAQLEDEIAAKFPDWIFGGIGSGYGDCYVYAERRGLVNGRTEKQYGADARHLLLAIEERERQFESMPDLVVPVTTGIDST